MKKLALWGVVGVMLAGSLAVTPAHAQLAGLSKAASKLASKVTGKPVSNTLTVSATDVAAPVASEKSARVTVLDKQTNRRQVIVLMAGEAQTVGTVQIKLNKCMPDYQAVLGQDVAWLDIIESAEGNGRSAPWFSGWMFNTYPEVSTLDHPRYDVQLQGCGAKARQVVKATGSAPVLDNSGPPVDTETPDDESTKDEDKTTAPSDPYTVPGVKDESVPAAPAKVEESPAMIAPQEGAPVSGPVEATPPAEEERGAAPAGGQEDLHKMMDSGQY